ncbi:DUF1402 family protein [Bauldia litoralis]|uniref:DUF1402 family protein n=1 Tax=Bauldia litoralis TaxID=665467 RepID=UPI003263DB94
MNSFRRFIVATAAALAVVLTGSLPAPVAAADVIVVPPGNQFERQPRVDKGSRALTAMGGGSFKTKYDKVYKLLASDPNLIGGIKKVASIYGIDPIHIIGAIVGEHTYNIDTYDTLQTYYVKAMQYVSNDSLVFANRGDTAAELFARPQFARCNQFNTNYEVWDCRQTTWEDVFMGRFVDGRRYPRDRLHRVYFGPAFAGQTFGFGQLSPVAALAVTDIVNRKAGLPLLSIDDAPEVYQNIMNPETSLHYVAANIRVSIDLYKSIAGFDISQNPGITATLYNLGNAATRARTLRAENAKRAKSGKPPLYPQENFYGWLVNDKEAELRKLL